MSEDEGQPLKPRIRMTIGDLADAIGMDATANLARSAGHTIGLGQDVIAQASGQGFGVGALDLSRLLASSTRLTLGQALIAGFITCYVYFTDIRTADDGLAGHLNTG